MARRVFFSFHYQKDIFRVNVVRKSNLIQDGTPFIDYSLWEESPKKKEKTIKHLIDQGLEGTTVTCVLIGSETASRPYVQYEIEQSRIRGNGLLGIFINEIKIPRVGTDIRGRSPFGFFDFFNGIRTYDWKSDNGYQNMGTWIERAYRSSKKWQREQEIQHKIRRI